MNPEIIGHMAGILTTLSLLPQTIKALRSDNTKSISLLMYSTYNAGVFLWFVYGVMLVKWPIIIFNAIAIPMAITILVKKIRNVVNKID